jgi:glycosyltransferase involved in cell wall biosynthesis
MRVTFLCDYAEEGWPSMDLVGTLVPDALRSLDCSIEVARLQPSARRWYGPVRRDRRVSSIRERLINRYVYYPRWLRGQPTDSGVFHVLDHSYAHLVHDLPRTRTVVTCHDLDAFACVMTPASSPQPWLLRQAVSRTMDGLRRAAAVVCVSRSVRDAVIQRGLAAPETTVVVANGVHPAFMGDPPPNDRAEADRLLDGAAGRRATVDLLHVGIPVERKRIDVALRVLARLQTGRRDARLVRVGGALPPSMRELARRLGVFDRVVELPFLSPGVLAAVYRRAGVLLVPSDREGFALPIVESLACGTPVIANDLPVLHETGNGLVRYRRNDDIEGWCRDIDGVLSRTPDETRAWRASAAAYAGAFTWRSAAERLVPIYRELSSR